MSTPAIFNGNPTFTSGSSTPFGLYDADTNFQQDAPKIAKWCAKRIGYPIVKIELDDDQLFACYEESVSEYAAQVQRFQIRQNLLDVTNTSKTDLTNKAVIGGITNLVTLAAEYGTEAGSGGNVDYKQGWITTATGSDGKWLQKYDLQVLFASASESGKRMEIRKVFHETSPATERFFDPYVGSGYGNSQMLDSFGWGNYSPATSYIVMPIYDDLLRLQQIEFNDRVRKSHYSFELHNNELSIFPIPKKSFKMWFQYSLLEDKQNAALGTDGNVSSFADINYNVMTYANINAPGKQWIKKYALALVKELLGSIRSKYGAIPIPGSEVNLDGDTLRSEGAAEKENLISQLREDLEASSRRNMLEAKKDESEFLRETITNIPLNIYTG